MKYELVSIALLLFSSSPSLAIPQPITDLHALAHHVSDVLDPRNVDVQDIWKRKGGGGGSARGGGSGRGSGSSSSGSSSSGSSSSGSSTSSSGSGSSLGSSSSSRGGSTKTGSGVRPAFAGGRFGGGGRTPYAAGSRSPGGISPRFFGLAVILAIFPGLWLAGAYSYPYTHPYTFRNHTATNSTQVNHRRINKRQDDQGVNQTKPVICLCAQNQECGCDDDGDTTVLDAIIGDGDYKSLNKSLVTVSDINGTSTIVINGTLPNGTTASGGTENASAAGGLRMVMEASGFWFMLSIVGATVWMI